MEYLESRNWSSESTITICHNVKVHITEDTIATFISDTLCCFINLFMAIISIQSNALVIRVVTKLPSGKTSGNLLLVSLAILELLKSGLVQPAFFIWKMMEIAKFDFCYPYLFTIIGNNFCTWSSFLHTCFLITMERYLGIFKPMLHRKPIVQRSFKIAAILTQIVLASFLLSMFFTFQHRVYFIVMCFVILTCLTATVMLYIAIRAKTRKAPMHQNISAVNKNAADRRMNKTVITIIIVSLACYLPHLSVFVFLSVHERTAFHTRFVVPWVYLLEFATAALNPFVYCWKNRRLRNEVMKYTARPFTSNSRGFEHSPGVNMPISQTTRL